MREKGVERCPHCGRLVPIDRPCSVCFVPRDRRERMQPHLEVTDATMRSRFAPVVGEHRLEFVAEKDGVRYVNDSKATNVNGTWYALEHTTGKVLWIAGGVDKGNDYSTLRAVVREKVDAIFSLGTDNSKIAKAFAGLVPFIINASSMREVVVAAHVYAEPGHTVLLSPACASFDLYENYEERGWAFKKEVGRL